MKDCKMGILADIGGLFREVKGGERERAREVLKVGDKDECDESVGVNREVDREMVSNEDVLETLGEDTGIIGKELSKRIQGF